MLFRRFASRALGAGAGRPARRASSPSSSTPATTRCNTPRGLNTANPRVQQALADAVTDLRSSGIPLDAPLRGYQYERRGTREDPDPRRARRPSASSTRSTSAGCPGQGYPNVPHGSSYVYTTQFTGRLPGDTLDPHLLAVDQPELALLRRPDPHVLEQAVGRRGLLRETRSRPTRTSRSRPISEPRATRGRRARRRCRVPLVPAYRSARRRTARTARRSRSARAAARRRRLSSSPSARPTPTARPANFTGFGALPGHPGRLGDAGRRGGRQACTSTSRTCATSRTSSDYTGELAAGASMRLTDRANGVTGSESATDGATTT